MALATRESRACCLQGWVSMVGTMCGCTIFHYRSYLRQDSGCWQLQDSQATVCFEDGWHARGRTLLVSLSPSPQGGPGPDRGGPPLHPLFGQMHHAPPQRRLEPSPLRGQPMRPSGTPRQAQQRLVAVCAQAHLGTAVDLLRQGQVPSLGRMVWKFHGGRTSGTCGSR